MMADNNHLIHLSYATSTIVLAPNKFVGTSYALQL